MICPLVIRTAHRPPLGRVLLSVACVHAVFAGCCYAQVLLFPNGESQPGELGHLYAGARTALSGSPEGGWYNPAGLARETATTVTVGVDLAQYQRASVGRSSAASAAPGSTYFAVATGSGRKRNASRLAYGLFVHWPLNRDIRVRQRRSEAVGASEVPSAVDPGGLDIFGDGIEKTVSSTGRGRMSVLSTGASVGFELRRWWRMGVGLHWERVQFMESSTRFTTFGAEGGTGDDATYRGTVQEASRYEGQLDRIVPVFGTQFDFGPAVTFGITVRFPSSDVGGSGAFELTRSSRSTFQVGDSPVTSLDDSIVAEGHGLNFDLRTPLEVRYGLGVAGAGSAFEIDVIQTEGVPSYTVLPLSPAEPPSSAAFLPPPYRTRLRPRFRVAMGAAFTLRDDLSTIFGLRTDASGNSGRDAVFRRIDLFTFTWGLVHTDGPLSGSLGISYQVGSAKVAFPSPLGEERDKRKTQYELLGIRLAVTVLL